MTVSPPKIFACGGQNKTRFLNEFLIRGARKFPLRAPAASRISFWAPVAPKISSQVACGAQISLCRLPIPSAQKFPLSPQNPKHFLFSRRHVDKKKKTIGLEQLQMLCSVAVRISPGLGGGRLGDGSVRPKRYWVSALWFGRDGSSSAPSPRDSRAW